MGGIWCNFEEMLRVALSRDVLIGGDHNLDPRIFYKYMLKNELLAEVYTL